MARYYRKRGFAMTKEVKITLQVVLAAAFAYVITYLSGIYARYPNIIPFGSFVMGLLGVWHKEKYTTMAGVVLVIVSVVILMVNYAVV